MDDMVHFLKDTRQNLKFAQLTLSGSRQNIFSSNVPEDRERYIFLIELNGDGTQRAIEIEKLEEDASYTMFEDNVYVPATEREAIPLGGQLDLTSPIMVLEGGTNLSFIAAAGAPEATVFFADNITI